MTPQEKVVAIALAEVGYKEKASNSQLDSKTANAGSANFNKYARDLDAIGYIYNYPKNGYDWCDIFSDWVYITAFGVSLAMQMTGQAYNGCGAGCGFSVNYYRGIGRFFKKNEAYPEPGDQIFYQSGGSICHTGIVIGFDGRYIATVEGNTGEQVKKMVRDINSAYVYGWGRPNWSLVKVEADVPETQPVVEEQEGAKQPVTHDEWMEHYERFRSDLQAKDPSNWSESDRNAAIAMGIFRGDDHGNFMWQDFLTREQSAALMNRLHKILKEEILKVLEEMGIKKE